MDVPDVQAELERIGHELAELDIVLVRTGRDAYIAEPGYMGLGPGVTVAATRWLFERGVRVMGIDAWGWDQPLHVQAQQAMERDEPGVFWAAHQADLPYSQIERLVNLDQLPPTGFKVACFPLRLVGGSAAPARVVAILERLAGDLGQRPEVGPLVVGPLRAGRLLLLAVDPDGAQAQLLRRADVVLEPEGHVQDLLARHVDLAQRRVEAAASTACRRGSPPPRSRRRSRPRGGAGCAR